MWGQWYDLNQAASYLRLDSRIVEELAEAGTIRGSKSRGRWTFTSDALDSFAKLAKQNEAVASFLELHQKPRPALTRLGRPPGTPKGAPVTGSTPGLNGQLAPSLARRVRQIRK